MTGAYAGTFSALDTLSVSDFLNIHFTKGNALVAVDTFVLIHFHSDYAYAVKERINSAERTDKSAKAPEHKYRQKYHRRKYGRLYYKKIA